MNLNFELILFYATLITGLICLFDWMFLAKKRQARLGKGDTLKLPVIIDYSRSFFPVLLVVFLLRSFLYEPFRIPSGSLEPTLQMGDFILVNKYDYGFKLPVLHTALTKGSKPERGDIIVFRWPPNPSYDFIKRVIGVPGDKVSYINKELYINGNKIPQMFLKNVKTNEEGNDAWQVIEKEEDLLGVRHLMYIDKAKSGRDYKDIVVPAGMYFVMGDNRDDSADSRYWGFVSEKDIVGKAIMVWMSWDGNHNSIRWDRLGMAIR